MSTYLAAIGAAIFVCLGLSRVVPSWRRPLMIVVVALMAATAFAPGLAPGVRILAVALTAALAIACVRGLRGA